MFDKSVYISINSARLDHLKSLNLPLSNSAVLEVGSGIGSLTGFFEDLGCKVLSTEARKENVLEHRKRHPNRRIEVVDLDVPSSHDRFGIFDIIFCYGTLYHLPRPAMVINDLSKICKKMFLLCTCVNHIDNKAINNKKDYAKIMDQGIQGVGCTPGRDWIMAELKKHFEYVYLTVSQPNHPEFPIEWPAKPVRTRAVFVASRSSLDDNPLLSKVLLSKQIRFK